MPDRPARILLVDDEQPIQTLLSFPLQRDGYEVVQASDGREALARFAEQTFDLVVLDVMLPKMDGLEVCRRLRARSSVPIIMLTAKSEEIDKVLGLELGADDYITKPFSMREFRSRVKAALRRAGMARPEEGDEQPIEVLALRIDPAKRTVTLDGKPVADDVRRVRDPRRARLQPGPRLHARHAALARLGRLRLPRPAHDRRPHPPPAREARGRRQGAGVHLHRARRRLPLPGHRRGVTMPRPLRSLRNRLTLIFALIVAGAIGIVYFYVTPRLEDELVAQKLERLGARGAARVRAAARTSIAHARGRADRARRRSTPRASRAPR